MSRTPEEKREAFRLATKKYREKNREIVRARTAQWAKDNREYVYKANAAWAKANREKVRPIASRWQKNNPEYRREKDRKRYYAELRATPIWFSNWDEFVVGEAKDLARYRTQVMGFLWHMDHIFPIQGIEVSGLHIAANIQVIPGVENCRKNNRLTLVNN